jgi:hypothetical protein
MGFVDYFLQVFDTENKEAKDKSWLADQIIPLIYFVKDEVEKGHYLSLLSEKLGVDERFVYDKYKGYKPMDKKQSNSGEKKIAKFEADERLMSLIICFYPFLKKNIQSLQEEYYSDSMKEVLILLKNNDKDVFDWSLLDVLDEKLTDRLRASVAAVELDYLEVDEEMIAIEFNDLEKKVQEVFRTRQKDDLETKIAQAEKAGEREKIKEYIRSLQDLIIKGK